MTIIFYRNTQLQETNDETVRKINIPHEHEHEPIVVENGDKEVIQPEEEEEEKEDNMEDQALDVKARSFMIEDFEVNIFKEEVGCIHEIVMPKGYKRASNYSTCN